MNLEEQTEYITNIDIPTLLPQSLTHAPRGPSEHCLACETDTLPIYTMLRQSSGISLKPQKIAIITLVYYMCPYHTMMTISSDSSTIIHTISISTVHPRYLCHCNRDVRDDNKENEYISLILGPHGLPCLDIVSNGGLSTRVQIQFYWMPISVQNSRVSLHESEFKATKRQSNKVANNILQSIVSDVQRLLP